MMSKPATASSAKAVSAISSFPIVQGTIVTDSYVGVSLQWKKDVTKPRQPIHFIVILDISGSMGTLVTVKQINEAGVAVDVCDGFTRIDLAVYCCKIVVKTLTESDYLTVMAFDDRQELLIDQFKMDLRGKAEAERILNTVAHRGGTNMWRATEVAFDTVARAVSADIKAAVHLVFFTDGETSDHPPSRRPSQSTQSMQPMQSGGYGGGGYGGGGYYQSAPVQTGSAQDWREAISLKMADVGYKCTLSTIGFTNNVKSDILVDMAKSGNGVFSFIPDGSFMITVISNLMANLMTTYATNATAIVTFSNGDSARINLGSARYDIPRSGVINRPAVTAGAGAGVHSSSVGQSVSRVGQIGGAVSSAVVRSQPAKALAQSSSYMATQYSPPESPKRLPQSKLEVMPVGRALVRQEKLTVVNVEITYVHPTGRHNVSIPAECCHIVTSDDCGASLSDELLFDVTSRQSFAETIETLTESRQLTHLQKWVDFIDTSISACPALHTAFVDAMLLDSTGEVGMACDSRYFDTWGAHYLRMLARAHATQTCVNFKDPGIQFYAGEELKSIIEEINQLIAQMAPPRPSQTARATRAAPTSGAAVNASYNNSSGPCFLGSCLVSTPSGPVSVDSIKVGDVVHTSTETGIKTGTAVVTHVLKTLVETVTELMASDSGLVVTKYHPIRIDGVWKFPADVPELTAEYYNMVNVGGAVYSFALSNDHVMIINDVEAICLGHGIEGDVVATHPYFGTRAVIADLDKLNSGGYVTITPKYIQRDLETGLICGISIPTECSNVSSAESSNV